ncbi:unnamed protein product [Adineta steineri]|uniref:catechol O-methyltransferase n=1 Tax=Adineta steineri TaxID=433720 RepID=A0A820H0C4_9BILA|nr:unnamed protein product [Adineta steineri]
MQSEYASFLNYVLSRTRPGDIHGVINTIDRYGWTKHSLMNIGDRKGEILDSAIQSRRPRTILELGTFLGYSSLRMAAQVPRNTRIVSIERDPEAAEVAHIIHKHAGVGNQIKIIVDTTENAIPRLKRRFHIRSLDFIFIDHAKSFYLRDFKLLERVGLIQSGTMIVADNVIYPGAPDYLRYVRNNRNYTTQTIESTLEYNDDIPDAVEITVRR